MALAVPQVEPLDKRHLAELTAQESYTVEGEQDKLRMVENHIHERMRKKHETLKKSLMAGGQMTDDEAEIKITSENMIQPLDIRHLPVGKDRYALIVGKGSGKKALYKVMVPCHVDTVPPSAEGMLELQTEEDGDTISGLGVHDMGTAVLNSEALAVDVEVSEGMQVYFVFLGSEELDSLHAKMLIESWEEWKDLKAIIASEIGSLIHHLFNKNDRDGDSQMRYILGRRGRSKYKALINVSPANQGHGAKDDTPNATQALFKAGVRLEDRFYKKTKHKGEQRLPLAKEHPTIGKEKLMMGKAVSRQTRKGLFGPDEAEMNYSILQVPDPESEAAGMSREDQGLQEQRNEWAEIAEAGEWDNWHIRATVVPDPDETSYFPYAVSANDAVQKIAAEIIELVSGMPPLEDAGDSPSDEDLFVAAMLDRLLRQTGKRSFEGTDEGIVNIPIRGGKPHKEGEWSSWYDTVRVRLVIKHLIENPKGLRSLYQKLLENAS